MPKRVVRFVVRRSRRFLGWVKCRLRQLFQIECPWQEVEIGEDGPLRHGRICGSCQREEIEVEAEASPDRSGGSSCCGCHGAEHPVASVETNEVSADEAVDRITAEWEEKDEGGEG